MDSPEQPHLAPEEPDHLAETAAPAEVAPEEVSADVPAEVQAPGNRMWQWIVAAVVVLLLAFPIVRRLMSSPGGTTQAAAANPALAAQTLINLSLKAYQAGRFDEAVTAAQGAIAADPNSADAYNNLAAAYGALGRWDEAIQAAQNALRLNPNHQLARANLAWSMQQKTKSGGSNPEAAKLLAQSVAAYNAGRYQECIDAGKAAIKLAPKLAAAYNNVAVGYAGLKDWDQEIQYANQALAIDPNFQIARNNLIFAMQQKKLGASGSK